MITACGLHRAGLMRRTLALLSILVSSPLFAQSGMWGQRGVSRSFAVHGNVLYAADGRGISAYDISAANTITRIDLEWGDDETHDVALMGTTDVVLATNGGVERFAINADGTLTRAGSTNASGRTTEIAANARYAAAVSNETLTILERAATGGFEVVRRKTFNDPITAVAFAGDYLYVSIERAPMQVLQPQSLAQVTVIPGADALDMAVSNGILWTASENDGLTAINVANPAQPKVVGSAGVNELRLRGVAAAGSRVYAFEFPNRVHVFDASDVEEPRLVSTLTEWVNVIGAGGNRLFVAGAIVEESGLAFDPGLIPRETGRPVRAFDATNLAAPVLAAEVEDLAGPVTGVWTDGSVAYVVDPPFLRVLDVSTTSAPREVTSLQIENLQDRIRVKNGIAVLYGRAYVNLLDVSIPLRPRHVGTWDAQGHPPSTAAILRTRIMEANDHSGMHVVDISDPQHAVQVGGRKWHYHDLATSDDAAYALLHDVMLVAEIANETTVVDQTEIHIQYDQLDISPPNSARPDLLLVRGGEGLRLYSLADRFHPEEVQFFPMLGLGLFATGDGTAYIEKDGRLYFLNLRESLALHPTEYRVTAPMQMSVAGEKIVVADRYSVRIYGPNTEAPPAAPARRRSVRP